MEDAPDPLRTRALFRLKVLGIMLVLVGGLFAFNGTYTAFVNSKDETWMERTGGPVTVSLTGAAQAQVILTYHDGSVTRAVAYAGQEANLEATFARFDATFVVNNETFTKRMYRNPAPAAFPIGFNATRGQDGFDAPSIEPAQYRVGYVYAAAAAMVILAGLSMVFRRFPVVGYVGSGLLCLLGVAASAGSLLFGLVLSGAGLYAILTIKRSRPLFT